MRIQQVLQFVGGSVAVYVAIAACGAAKDGGASSLLDAGAAREEDGEIGDEKDAPAMLEAALGDTSIVADTSSSIVDALTDPVPKAAADPNASGTRLKVKYMAGADGSKQSIGLFDATLGVDCAYAYAADAKLRCLPVADSVVDPLFSAVVGLGSYAFSDAACTMPLTSTVTVAAPKYLIATDSTIALPAGVPVAATRVFVAGAVYSGAVYSLTPTACAHATTHLPPGSSYYSAGAEVLPPMFVAGTIMVEP